MRNNTADTMASVVARPSDPFGLAPVGEALPRADMYAFLTATDSFSANVRLHGYIVRKNRERMEGAAAVVPGADVAADATDTAQGVSDPASPGLGAGEPAAPAAAAVPGAVVAADATDTAQGVAARPG